MHVRNALSLASIALCSACAPADAGARVGHLEVALTSTFGQVDYHLTGARLRIDGPEPQEVSLDGPGDVSLALPAGPYQLTLEEGWSLAREEAGELVPVAAQLLSDNPTSLFLGAGSSEQLSFRFALEAGEVLQSGDAHLEVGFVLAEAGVDDFGEGAELGCGARLRINEVDYDQQGTDDAEFVELLNTGLCDASLAGVSVELVNGSTGAAYASVALDSLGVLAGEGHLVIGDPAVLAALPQDVPALPLPGSGLQNGPDSVRLSVDGVVIDVFGYGEGAPEAEGSPAADDGPETSLGRCPNGFDSEDNGSDFSDQSATPGLANAC